MSKHKNTFERVLSGKGYANIDFDDICALLERLGFECRKKGGGSHLVYTKQGVREIINIQPDNGKAKPYQVRQICGIITLYQLQLP